MKWSIESSFNSSSDNVKIAYAALTHKPTKAKTTIAFFTGWKEAYAKYLPFLTTLHNLGGFNIYVMEWRGQGLSGDTPGTAYEKGNEDSSGKRICFVEDFEPTYLHDMRQFLLTIVKPTCAEEDSSICVIGHSMGGCLAARLAQLTGKSLFDRMVLSAPMILHKNVLDVGGLFDLELPISVASAFASLMLKMKLGATKADGRDTNAAKYTTQLLTHSKENLDAWNKIRAENPEFVLAGASFAWANAALKMEKTVMKDADKIEVPTLLFAAENDKFVYSSATKTFAKRLGTDIAMLVGPIANSYHELLFEIDDIVTPILNTACEFAQLGKSNVLEAFPENVLSAIKSIPISRT